MRKLGPLVPGRRPAAPQTGATLQNVSARIAPVTPASAPPQYAKQVQDTLKSQANKRNPNPKGPLGRQ